MKYFLILSFAAILFMPQAFAEESFNGYSSIDPPLSTIVAGKSTEMNIRFLYTSGPYVLNNFTPIIEVIPSGAKQFVQVDVGSIEIKQGQIKRIHVTLSVDPHIEHDKIFLSISYAGYHFQSDELHKSSWNDHVSLDVMMQDSPVPEPEPEQDRSVSENCPPDTTLQDGICVVEESQKKTMDSSGKWKAVTFPPALQLGEDNRHVLLFDNFFSITEKQARYDVFYNVTHAVIDDVQLNCDSASFTLSIISDDDGVLQLDVPSSMLGGIFMVLVNDKEWEDVSLDGNVLTVNFTKDTATIEVLGTYNLGTGIDDGVCDVVHDPPYSYILSPLNQIKSGVPLVDVKCSEEKSPAYKYDRMRVACVSEETLEKLWTRGWATMRFYTAENTSPHALCNNYQGKWHPEYEGCRDVNDLQCSLIGGEFVDGLKICYDGICPADKTYTLCVTNLDLVSGEKENEN